MKISVKKVSKMNYIDIEDEYGVSEEYFEIIEDTINVVAKKEKLPLINVCVLLTDTERKAHRWEHPHLCFLYLFLLFL